MTFDITLKEYENAYNRIKKFIKTSELEFYKDNIYLKNEKEQITDSFKWSGVLFAVMKVFDKIVNDKILNYCIVTQSTGNHGIATIRAVNILIDEYISKYPQLSNIFKSIRVIIFTNKSILKNKLNKMNNEINNFKYNNNSYVDCNYENYEQSLIARENYLKQNVGSYIEHGGKDIMTGYGSIAFSLDKQISKNKKINFYCSVGAGGPIGIGLCLKKLRNINFNIVQTEGFDCFINSIKNNKIEKNKKTFSELSDGIAVDKPEIFALEVGKKIINNCIVVSEKYVKKIKLTNNFSNSTNIALSGFYKIVNERKYDEINIILNCE